MAWGRNSTATMTGRKEDINLVQLLMEPPSSAMECPDPLKIVSVSDGKTLDEFVGSEGRSSKPESKEPSAYDGTLLSVCCRAAFASHSAGPAAALFSFFFSNMQKDLTTLGFARLRHARRALRRLGGVDTAGDEPPPVPRLVPNIGLPPPTGGM